MKQKHKFDRYSDSSANDDFSKKNKKNSKLKPYKKQKSQNFKNKVYDDDEFEDEDS